MRGSSPAMATTRNVMRSSLNAFFQSYHCFTSIAALLVFPLSVSVLLSELLTPSFTSVLNVISYRLQAMFRAAGFPASAFSSLLSLKLSQTIFTFIFSLPFTLSFLLLAKACVISIFVESQRSRLVLPPFSKILPLYPPLLFTHVFNSFVMLSSNAATFSLLFLLFNAVDLLGLTSDTSLLVLSASGAVMYSVVIGIATVTCNLAMIVSAMENCSGYSAVLKACVLIKGHVSTALALALLTNLAMAATEALFQFRVMSQYRQSGKFNPSVLGEAFSITYIHSVCTVLEIIISYMFFKTCKQSYSLAWYNGPSEWREFELEDKADLEA